MLDFSTDGPVPAVPGYFIEQWPYFLDHFQSNILKSNNRAFCSLVFVEFTNLQQQEIIKNWLAHWASNVTSARQQLDNSKNPDALFVNCHISREGLKDLNINMANQLQFPEEHYDDIFELTNDKQNKEEAFDATFHLMISVAHNNKHVINEFIEQTMVQGWVAAGIQTSIHIETGAVQQANGYFVEAFGFRDGISQPEAIKETNLDEGEKWEPGRHLPLFFCAFEKQDQKDYGAFAVYLKIRQHKNIFEENIDKIIPHIHDEGIDKRELAAAYLMGRFKDGTPVLFTNRPTGGNESNDFDYNDDPHRMKCPGFAHIFKAHPRDPNNEKRRIIRRSIPFEASDGLHFLCYQNNIEEQFLHIYKNWICHPQQPGGRTDLGKDLLMCGDEDIPEVYSEPKLKPLPRIWGDDSRIVFANMHGIRLKKPTTVTGIGFFFVPSLFFLKNIQQL